MASRGLETRHNRNVLVRLSLSLSLSLHPPARLFSLPQELSTLFAFILSEIFLSLSIHSTGSDCSTKLLLLLFSIRSLTISLWQGDNCNTCPVGSVHHHNTPSLCWPCCGAKPCCVSTSATHLTWQAPGLTCQSQYLHCEDWFCTVPIAIN